MVEGLEGQPGGKSTVADDGDRPAIGADAGDGHPQGTADRGAGVSHAEGVVLAFIPLREWRQPSPLAYAVQAVLAAGQYLVHIGLVAHVPDQPVIGCVVQVMEGDGEFHGAQAGGKMAAVAAGPMQQKFPDFHGQRLQLGFGQGAQIGRVVDFIEYGRF